MQNPNIRKAETKYVPVPPNVLIAGRDTYYSKDPFITWNNNNLCCCATSGGGKSRLLVRPALIQAEGSYIVSDPKGTLYKDFAKYLISKGYKVIHMDFIHPEKSVHYNPILFCQTTQDVQKLAHSLVYNMHDKQGRRIDPFWDEASFILFCALISYMLETTDVPDNKKNLTTLSKLVTELRRPDSRTKSALEIRLEEHAKKYYQETGKESWAFKRFKEFNTAADKTYATILITSLAKLCTFDTEELRIMLEKNDLDFTKIGTEKTAIFVEVSDSDRSMDTLVNLFYTQLMNILCSFADDQCKDSRLPIPTTFLLDDFGTNCRIDNFENIISNIRSRNISAWIMIQSENQLYTSYGESAGTIINNCSTYIYLGSTDPEMARKMSLRVNKQPSTILNMPVNMSYVCRRGQEPVYIEHFDVEWFEKEMGFVKGKSCQKRAPKRNSITKHDIPEEIEGK